ncbi:MAG TPA: Bax inhibitor-1/YccA family protein [Thermoanaerobaculia bacterium]|nr:Bax inhibitor-1/YccA family protein [Thermoanaerobaculia bacterium]
MSQFPQFPVNTAVSMDATRTRERDFIRSVYGWMFGGLLLTAAAAAWVVFSPAMQQIVLANRAVFWMLAIAEIGLVFYLSLRIQKMSPAAAASAFLVYSLLNGLTLSVIFFVYQLGSIMQAFVVAGGMFGAMSIYGMVTKRDLTSWGSFFFMGLIGVILASVVNIFLRSPALTFAVSIIGVFVFVGLTAYDTQKLKGYARMATGDRATNLAVIGALALYLDFINLFLMLLRLLGDRRS